MNPLGARAAATFQSLEESGDVAVLSQPFMTLVEHEGSSESHPLEPEHSEGNICTAISCIIRTTLDPQG